MDVKRGSRPSRGQLLDEQELSAGLLSGSFHGHQHSEKPQRLSVLRAECVGVGLVFMNGLLLAALARPVPFPPL